MASQEHVGWDIAADTHTHGFKNAFCIRPFQPCFSKSPCHPPTSTAALESHAQLLLKKVSYCTLLPSSFPLTISACISPRLYSKREIPPPLSFPPQGHTLPQPIHFSLSLPGCTPIHPSPHTASIHPTQPPTSTRKPKPPASISNT